MDKQKALDRLNLIRMWYEDYGTPDADYDAICYAIGVIEEAPEGLDNLIKALEQEHKKLLEMQKALPEIVHCKDCKNWIPFDWMFSETWQSQNRDDYTQDEIGCSYGDMAMKADDYCSRAERRTDERSD